MLNDEIVDEVRAIREAHAAKFGKFRRFDRSRIAFPAGSATATFPSHLMG
ncbi:MAG: hypothetical protein IPK39_20055 [Sulfuritalea sp.]|nr:hypothetical protein [Sulfuritalea sp.]